MIFYRTIRCQSDFSSFVSHPWYKYDIIHLSFFDSFHFSLNSLYLLNIWFDIDSNNSDTFGVIYVRPIQPDITTHTDSTYRFQASYSSIHHEPSNNNPLGKRVFDHSLKWSNNFFQKTIKIKRDENSSPITNRIYSKILIIVLLPSHKIFVPFSRDSPQIRILTSDT